MARRNIAVLVFTSLCLCLPLVAQNATEKAITSKFALTKSTADRSDIVTAGAVLVLKKDNFVMFSSQESKRSTLVYKDGKITASGMMKFSAFSRAINSSAAQVTQRTFVAGEKFWLIGVQTQQDGLVLEVLSDPYNDIRYTAQLKFPFPKGAPPTPEDMLARVSEVVDLDAPAQPDTPAPAPAPEPPAVALAPLAPPPPPPDAAPPPTISMGEKKADVIAAFGPPEKTARVGGKEILSYKDMKVTLTAGKVSDVQ